MEVISILQGKEQIGLANRGLIARLKTQMLKKGLNPKTLAEKANVGRSFVYDILNGKSNNPTSAKLTAIAQQLDVSVQYLLSGTSGVFSGSNNDLVEIQALGVESSSSGMTVATAETTGHPYYFNGQWVKDRLKSNQSDLKAVTIAGDSMIPTLNEGDVVLVNTHQKNPTPAGLFVLFDGLGLHAKRLELISKDKVRIISDNSQYSAYDMNLAELNIVGRIVWMAREL